MKYCTYCGTRLEQDSKFCIHCGKACEPDDLQWEADPDYSRYWGMRFFDLYGCKTYLLTPNGLRIHKKVPLKSFCFDKLVPYLDILDLHIKEPRMTNPGSLTIATPDARNTANPTAKADYTDPYTIWFNRKHAHLFSPFYQALKDIADNPPLHPSDDHTLETESIPPVSVMEQFPPYAGYLFLAAFVLGFIGLVTVIF